MKNGGRGDGSRYPELLPRLNLWRKGVTLHTFTGVRKLVMESDGPVTTFPAINQCSCQLLFIGEFRHDLDEIRTSHW